MKRSFIIDLWNKNRRQLFEMKMEEIKVHIRIVLSHNKSVFDNFCTIENSGEIELSEGDP